MPRTKTGTVYALVDPRDGKIRYVGKTMQPVLDRLAGHLAQPTNPAMRVWIAALSREGRIPHVRAVATVPEPELSAEEDRQIRDHVAAGHRLLNSPYYRENVADLSGRPVPATKLAPKPQMPQKDLRLARWMYASLAHARAEGRVPGPAVAVAVLLTAPLYAAVVALRALLRLLLDTGPGRVLAGSAGMCWMLWDAGFDKAVRDLLLPHLPLEESLLLWSTYVEPPLSNLATFAAQASLVIAAGAATVAYSDVSKGIPTKRTPGDPETGHDAASA